MRVCGVQDLDKAREGLCLDSDLHLCYLITPQAEDVCRNWETCCHVIRSLQVIHSLHPSATAPSTMSMHSIHCCEAAQIPNSIGTHAPFLVSQLAAGLVKPR